jgi:dihydropteroate synthase
MGNEDVITWPGGQLDFSDGCVIMGVLNVTPDSFSDGGKFFDADKAIARGIKMVQEGAAIIDVGGESSRPGSEPVSTKEQIRRVVGVIEGLAYEVAIPISIDTYDTDVAKAALDAGASMINDITALADEAMGKLAANAQVPVVLMHMQGQPRTMQVEPRYEDVVEEVLAFLIERAKWAQEQDVSKERVFIDPGIGFGKKLEHNLELLRNLERFVDTGYRVLVGTSRKSFIGTLTGKENPVERVFGTAATVAHCVMKGVSIIRVHDVSQMMDVVKVANALRI